VYLEISDAEFKSRYEDYIRE